MHWATLHGESKEICIGNALLSFGLSDSLVSLIPLGNNAIRLIVFQRCANAEVALPPSRFQLRRESEVAYFTLERAMKESTATAVNMMVGISMTTADPTLVLKKVMVASQPLVVGRQQN